MRQIDERDARRWDEFDSPSAGRCTASGTPLYRAPRLKRFGSMIELTQRRWFGGGMDSGARGAMTRTA